MHRAYPITPSPVEAPVYSTRFGSSTVKLYLTLRKVPSDRSVPNTRTYFPGRRGEAGPVAVSDGRIDPALELGTDQPEVVVDAVVLRHDVVEGRGFHPEALHVLAIEPGVQGRILAICSSTSVLSSGTVKSVGGMRALSL